MKGVRIHSFGGPEVLQLDDLPQPSPQAGEVVVRTEAAGVNFIDIYHRTGAYKNQLPVPLGQEGAGTVTALGDGVADLKVGDRVAWTNVFGSYAEYNAVPVGRLVTLPSSVTFKQGAAVMLQGMTAHYLATSTYALKPGEACLVHAGAGGVGLLLTQIAKARGARVMTTVGSDEKAELSRQAGADAVIVYSRQDFPTEVKRLTDGRGVQVVYDSVGQSTFEGSLDSLAKRGMLVLFGQSSGAVPPFNPGTLAPKGSLFLTRPTLADYIAGKEELRQRANDLFGWIASGELRLRIDSEYPLTEVAAAHRALESRQTSGKILLQPRS